MFFLKEYREPTNRLPDLLPWAALIGPGLILQKDGLLQKTFAFRGLDLLSSTPHELGNLTLGRNEFVANTGNSIGLKFDGVTTLTDNARINSNELTLDGVVTDGGAGFTLNKVGGNLFLNNANNDYSGGTVVTGGQLFFGARGPDVVRFPGFGNFVPNDKARAGTGPIFVNLGEGKSYALAALAGALVGAGAFGVLYERLQPLFALPPIDDPRRTC